MGSVILPSRLRVGSVILPSNIPTPLIIPCGFFDVLARPGYKYIYTYVHVHVHIHVHVGGVPSMSHTLQSCTGKSM